MPIDFDKLLKEYLQEFESKNPNPENNTFVDLNKHYVEISANVCVRILKKYHDEVEKISLKEPE